MTRLHAAWVLLLVLASAVGSSWAAPEPRNVPAGMGAADHENLVANLRWMLARERAAGAGGKKGAAQAARVGILADAGAWHPSVRSVAAALEQEGVPCRGLDGTLVTAEGLAGLEAVVLVGGWAPFQQAVLGDAGTAALRAFVAQGGRCLGICAGAFLLSRTVAWEGEKIPYALALFDGTAEGPIATLAAWPQRAAVRLTPTAEGKRRGLQGLAAADVLYYGGPRLVGGTDVTVLAAYPDATPAIVARRVERGEVVLVGPHLERPASPSADDAAPAPASAGPLLRALLRL